MAEQITQEQAEYRLRSDDKNWIIQKARRKQTEDDTKGQPGTGELYWVDDGFFGRLDQAALEMLDRVGRKEAQSHEIAELIVIIRKARDYVVSEINRVTADAT